MTFTVIELPSGENMAIARYGAKGGKPVLFCHGAPGLRFTPHMEQIAEELNILLIVPDRPGYGHSDFKPGATALRWVRDISHMMDAFGIYQFAVVGFSAGGMYALACAYALPQRISAVAIAGSISPVMLDADWSDTMLPLVKQSFCAARDNPQELKAMLLALSEQPEQLYNLFAQPLPPADQMVLIDSAIRKIFMMDCAEILRTGVDGLICDFALASKDWGFNLRDISTKVALWHGMEDINVPYANAQYLATHLRQARLYLQEGEGHLCLFKHWQAMLMSLDQDRDWPLV